MHWFGVGPRAVWNWRRKFVDGPGKFRTPGSKPAHGKASRAGAVALKEHGLTAELADAMSKLDGIQMRLIGFVIGWHQRNRHDPPFSSVKLTKSESLSGQT